MANAAPDGNPTTAATTVAEKLTIRESATIWASVAVPKDFQTSNTGIYPSVSAGRILAKAASLPQAPAFALGDRDPILAPCALTYPTKKPPL
jgi:hypothetical protein